LKIGGFQIFFYQNMFGAIKIVLTLFFFLLWRLIVQWNNWFSLQFFCLLSVKLLNLQAYLLNSRFTLIFPSCFAVQNPIIWTWIHWPCRCHNQVVVVNSNVSSCLVNFKKASSFYWFVVFSSTSVSGVLEHWTIFLSFFTLS
jgi:hypothetical protein